MWTVFIQLPDADSTMKLNSKSAVLKDRSESCQSLPSLDCSCQCRTIVLLANLHYIQQQGMLKAVCRWKTFGRLHSLLGYNNYGVIAIIQDLESEKTVQL